MIYEKIKVENQFLFSLFQKGDVKVLFSLHYNVSTDCFRFHRLVIDEVKPEDAGDYTFVPDGYALSLSAKLNFLGEEDRVITKASL